MASSFETDPSNKSTPYLPETQAILEQLFEDPTINFQCIHGDGPAVSICEVPEGCVVFPGEETQALCPSHRLTDGSFQYMNPIVDLSINGKWSDLYGEEPDYCAIKLPESGEIKIVPFLDRKNSF